MPVEPINVTLGTAGHIDHGKTALVKNLTGCDTDRLKEEKERGMSIELGFAPCRIGDLQVGIVDVPGHEHFVRTMVAGATGMDAVILVVAADDGIMPQTREHLEILTLLGVQQGLVALTKIDKAGPELTPVVAEEVRGYVKGTFLENSPIIPVSNVTGEGFDRFIPALKSLVQSVKPRTTDGVFRLPVERAFSVQGYGTVIAGIPVSGTARIDDELELLPQGEKGRVKAIQVFKRTSDIVKPGQCTAINVRQWDHNIIRRGNVIAAPGYFWPSEWFVAKMRILGHENLYIKNGMQAKFHTGTTESQATVYLMEQNTAGAGEECFVQFRLAEAVVAGPGDRFIVRSLSPVATIGGGIIIEAVARRLKRNRPQIRQEMEEWFGAIATEKGFAEYVVKTAGVSGIGPSEVSLRTKMPIIRAQEILHDLTNEGRIVRLGQDLLVHQEAFAKDQDKVVDCIKNFHDQSPQSPGITSEELQSSSGLPKQVLDGLIHFLRQHNKVVERNQRYALPEHKEIVSDGEQKVLDAIEAIYRKGQFAPPDIQEAAVQMKLPPQKMETSIKILLEHSRLVKVPEGLLFHREAVEKAREILTTFIQKEGKLESVKFKYLLNTSRKYALPLLDHFDRIGLTLRINNTRYLKTGKK